MKIEEIKYALTNSKIVASAVLMNFVVSPLFRRVIYWNEYRACYLYRL
ncbi:hypothetical protein J7L06_07110 [Candidatus Bathyarchaeota archaeon]|nr:hypothetical protein [Candidatus Bathyarchaeota archaeon]